MVIVFEVLDLGLEGCLGRGGGEGDTGGGGEGAEGMVHLNNTRSHSPLSLKTPTLLTLLPTKSILKLQMLYLGRHEDVPLSGLGLR